MSEKVFASYSTFILVSLAPVYEKMTGKLEWNLLKVVRLDIPWFLHNPTGLFVCFKTETLYQPADNKKVLPWRVHSAR